METVNRQKQLQQSCPFNTDGLGNLKEVFSSDELRFAKKSLLWILLPIIGWLVLVILCIQYCVRKYPSRSLWVFENGFVWVKGESVQCVFYADIDVLEYSKVANYKNGVYQQTVHSFKALNGGKTIYKNVAWDNNEHNVEEKMSYLVKAFQKTELEIQNSLIERAKKEFDDKGYVTLVDDEVIVGENFIRDKSAYDFTSENIGRAYCDWECFEIVIEGNDYKNKMIGYDGHKLVLSLESNRILKMVILEKLLGWQF